MCFCSDIYYWFCLNTMMVAVSAGFFENENSIDGDGGSDLLVLGF